MGRLSFVKMQGLGNDYIIFDFVDEGAGDVDLAGVARRLCKRRFGVGADGLVAVLPGRDGADFSLRIFNPDGSETGACGTAFRCVAWLVFSQRGFSRAAADGITLATSARTVRARVSDEEQRLVEVGIGVAQFKRSRIPVAGRPDEEFIDQRLRIDGKELVVSAVSVGNPHAVILCKELKTVPVERWGPAIENHELFPERTNVEFVQVLSENKLAVRVWERGTGQTLSCGTGACASFAVARRLGLVTPPVAVLMPGGEITVTEQADGEILMRASVEPVYSGWVEYEA